MKVDFIIIFAFLLLSYSNVLANVDDLEQRSRELFKITRCLICEGESIQHSKTEFSSKMRDLITQQINSGKSNQEIKNYLREIYGNYVLFEPSFGIYTYFLWLLPIAFIVIGGLIIYKHIYRATQKK